MRHRLLLWVLLLGALLGSCSYQPDDAELKASVLAALRQQAPELADRILDAYSNPDDDDALVIQTDYAVQTSVLYGANRICDVGWSAVPLTRAAVTSKDLTTLWECDDAHSTASDYMAGLKLQEEAQARAAETRRLEEERREATRKWLEEFNRRHGRSYGGSCGADYYENVDGNCVRRPSTENHGGATARCRDGTYSYSQNRRGTCSHHGGVAEWY